MRRVVKTASVPLLLVLPALLVAATTLAGPQSVVATCSAAGTSVSVTWSSVAGATKYLPFVQDTTTGTYVPPNTATSYSFKTSPYVVSVIPGHTIKAYVYAYNAAGVQSKPTYSTTVTCSPPPPPAPTLTANPTSLASGSVATISWDATNSSCDYIDVLLNGTIWFEGAAGSFKKTMSTSPLMQTTQVVLQCKKFSGQVSVASAPVTITVLPPPPPHESSGPTINWSSTGLVSSPVPEWKSLPTDISVTGIKFSTNWQKGATADYCLAAYRDQSPSYPAITGGYAELLCLNLLQLGATGPWSRYIDLSATPLYIPANTKLTCNTSGGTTAVTAGTRSCVVEYKTYNTGDARYRILRIPYLDTGLSGQSDLFYTSHYIGTPSQPLVVKGYQLYDGVVGTYTACLERLNGQNGSLIQQDCLPTNTKTLSANNEPAAFKPVNWTFTYPDMLSAHCVVSGVGTSPWDCGFYVIAQIPNAVAPGAENIFRDYGNVVPSMLQSWCGYYIDNLALPAQATQLCGSQSCTRAQKVAACVAAFPTASCVATNSCSAAPPMTVI